SCRQDSNFPHVPAGYTSAMFTHPPSPTVFIDADHYIDDEPLGFWLARTLGNQQFQDAEKAQPFRNRLKQASNPGTLRSDTESGSILGFTTGISRRAEAGAACRC